MRIKLTILTLLITIASCTNKAKKERFEYYESEYPLNTYTIELSNPNNDNIQNLKIREYESDFWINDQPNNNVTSTGLWQCQTKWTTLPQISNSYTFRSRFGVKCTPSQSPNFTYELILRDENGNEIQRGSLIEYEYQDVYLN